ncbi:hypothetical protein DQ04_00291190 [Trypanosoma grayi]|uniref:hypothetical protein n=1 Tax=Trypanosoma grayi TaxID=71804 RepID=UPI0004F43805|nr:hypothetical protein DQ04_00291190 [Trypanosoma grayi]KEG14833.1 hypothetical protein DQ04_00291190 [Trypanosoma grayi]
MSKWSSLRKDGDMFGEESDTGGAQAPCGYIFDVPLPVAGSSLPMSAVDIVTIKIPHSMTALDTARNRVTWYQVLVRTTSHRWSVLKRFSEFFELDVAMRKVGLVRLAKLQLQKSFSSPPSRLSLTQWRQKKLEKFMQSLLQVLKEFSVIVVGGGNGEALSGTNELRQRTLEVTRAAFACFLRFLTTTSHDAAQDGNADENDTALYAPKETTLQALSVGERGYVPPAKIVHVPRRHFAIMLQLPGATMSTVFVDSVATAERPREIVVGGCWNGNITGLPSVLTDPQDAGLSSTDSASAGGLEPTGAFKVLVDTFPSGDFQMRFEVPPPFAIDEWQSDYAAGVLFLTWRSDVTTPHTQAEGVTEGGRE